MKHFITSLIFILLLTGCSVAYTQAYAVQYDNTTSYTMNDIDTLIELIAEQDSLMDAAHQMAEAARQLGYAEDHEVILLAQEEYNNASEIKESYEVVYDNLMAHWQQKEDEYPVAAYIWNYFKDLGYNDYVIAGILGNIMAEVGGQTLNIDYTTGSSSYYGICQWSTKYSNVYGASLEEQCQYLADTIEYEFNTYGSNYKSGFDYEDFINLTDARQAAKAFMKCYERCSANTTRVRQSNAVTAYNYFVG